VPICRYAYMLRAYMLHAYTLHAYMLHANMLHVRYHFGGSIELNARILLLTYMVYL
jgi:hypothetical protein